MFLYRGDTDFEGFFFILLLLLLSVLFWCLQGGLVRAKEFH